MGKISDKIGELRDPIKKIKHAGGRPRTNTIDRLPDNWIEECWDLSARGFSKNEIYLHWYNRAPKCFVELCNRDLEFATVIKNSEKLYYGWWETQGRENIHKRYW